MHHISRPKIILKIKIKIKYLIDAIVGVHQAPKQIEVSKCLRLVINRKVNTSLELYKEG